MARRIALLIGNTDYDEKLYFSKLVTPGQNVHDLAHALAHPERCGFEVTTLLNASKNDAEKQILKLFRNKTPDDFLILYFAGHGLKDDNGALYFAMKETEREAMEATAVAASFVKSRMEKSYSERIVIILDCCFSAAFGDTMAAFGETVDIQREFESKGYGHVVLTATNVVQYAWDRTKDEVIGEAKNSLFTRYLIEGISTDVADRNGDGEITVDELFSYIYERTIRTVDTQTPQKKVYRSAGDLVIAWNPTPSRLSSDLLSSVTHPKHFRRFAAANELEDLLYIYNGQKNTQMVEQIQATLTQLSHDRHKEVSERAIAILDDFAKRDATADDEAQQLRLFIAAPDDVMEEREIVRRVVEKLNKDNSSGLRAQISTVVRDDTDPSGPISVHATPPTRPFNEEVLYPSACDIVVVIFWSKIGNPLPTNLVKEDGTSYESGTEWEYEDAVSGAKRNHGRPIVLVYRNDQLTFRPSETNLQEKIAEFQKVERFFTKFSDMDGFPNGGCNFYRDVDQFEAMLEEHLRTVIQQLAEKIPLAQPQQAGREIEVQVEMLEMGALNELREMYLHWMIEQHRLLKLRGLGGDAKLPTVPLEKVYVALKGSRANAYEREQSQELLVAEMAGIIAGLKEEMPAAKFAQLLAYAERRAIIINPYMPSIIERDRPGDASMTASEKAEIVTLGEAFRKERWMVILGDPGSGKTTLARWIALKLAIAWIHGEDPVQVPAYQVDPKVVKSDPSIIDIGPVRLPVLVRVSEFSEAYQRAHQTGKTLSIADFLGYHSWAGQAPNIPQQTLNALIKHYLRSGRAVVILDGMDEITEANQRDNVVQSIETFIKDWINARGEAISAQEKAFYWHPLAQGEPATTGGNQIIITSRIAGYQATQITGHVAHFIIQPMQQGAVEHFCDAWTLAIHQELNPQDRSEIAQEKAELEATGLKAAIFDPHRPRVRELASNPLLVTILALVYRNNKGRLPEQRAELYQTAMKILIDVWRNTRITTVELIYVLSPLAAHIHQHYSSGRIEEDEMKEIITRALAEYRKFDVSHLPPSFVLEVNDFIKCVKEDVGLLAESSTKLYSFLHLTFQEYLAALYLVRDPQNAPQAIIDKLDDPRWREPILMALGHINVNDDNWGPTARQRLLTALLNADDPLGNLIPRSALLIVSAIPEMPRVAEDVVREIIRRLLTTYEDRDGSGQFTTLRERIGASFKSLYTSDHRHLLEQYLADAIRDIEKGDRSLALAAASLVAEHAWQSDQLLKALLKAFPHDDPDWEYPITRTLNKVALLARNVSAPPQKPEMEQEDKQEIERLRGIIDESNAARSEESRREDVDGANAHEDTLTMAEVGIKLIEEKYHKLFAAELIEHELRVRESQSLLATYAEALPFRRSLEENPELVDYIKSDLAWLRLIILLYGGISDDGLATYAVQYSEIAVVLALEEDIRLYHVAKLREKPYWRESWDTGDVVYNLAVYLDTECGTFSKKAEQYVPQFKAQAILNDSPLTPLLLNALQQRKHPSTLKKRLWREWHTAGLEMRRVHALLALLLLDTQPALEAITQRFNDTTTSALAELVLNQLKLRKHTVADALILLGKKAKIGAALQPLQATLADEQWGDLVEIFFRTFTSVMPFPVGYDEVLLTRATSIPRINAEIWACWLSGLNGDDPRYSYAVILDTLGEKIESASALINMQRAYNGKYDKFTHWHLLPIPPEYTNYADVIGEALTIASKSRSEMMRDLFYAGTMKYVASNERAESRVNYQDYPGLKEDALAAALLLPFEFQQDTIELLETGLAEASAYELINQILARVVSITDNVIKARALWRVAQYRGYWRNLNVWDLASDAAEQINDPLHRSRAFERLINYVPRRQSERIKKEALQAARKIGDPNNQARALARLALYENNEKRWAILADALTAVREITSEQQQVETIQLIRPYLEENRQLKQAYTDIVENTQNDWQRNKSRNILSTQLLMLHDQLHEPPTLTPVILASLIDELVDLKPQQSGGEDRWNQLLDPTKREFAVAALLRTAAANGLEGLYLTPKIFDVMCSLLDAHEISAMYMLLPYFRGVEPSLLPLLNNWIDNPPDKVVWAYSGLLLAEMGQVNPSTIPCLIELLENGIDFGRYRAGIVLHGPIVFLQKSKRDFRTSQLREQSLLLLARTQKRALSERIQNSTQIRWIYYNIVHDDPILLQQIIDYSDAEDDNEDNIANLLKAISYCDEDFLNALIKQFEEGSLKTQELLLHSWLNLAQYHFEEKITPEQRERIEETILKLPGSSLENILFIPTRLATTSYLLCSLGKRVEEEHLTFQTAISALNQELSALSLRLPGTPLEELTKHMFYHIPTDPQDALDAAEAVSENGTSLELLFAWLAACLRESLDDFPETYYRTSTLLEIAGAVTHFSPAAVYNLCAKNALGPMLVQATMYHQTFWGRVGAATLLGYLRQTPDSFDEALLSGLYDVAPVQTTIFQMVQNLRYVDERMIPRLLLLLDHESASVVYAISRLLASIARNEKTSPTLRQRIVRALNDTIQHRDALRPVFLIEEANASIFIRNIGRLDQQLYSAINTIIGIA